MPLESFWSTNEKFGSRLGFGLCKLEISADDVRRRRGLTVTGGDSGDSLKPSLKPQPDDIFSYIIINNQ